jgi:hypothetical protein
VSKPRKTAAKGVRGKGRRGGGAAPAPAGQAAPDWPAPTWESAGLDPADVYGPGPVFPLMTGVRPERVGRTQTEDEERFYSIARSFPTVRRAPHIFPFDGIPLEHAAASKRDRARRAKALRDEVWAVWMPMPPLASVPPPWLMVRLPEQVVSFSPTAGFRGGLSHGVQDLAGGLYSDRTVYQTEGTFWLPDILYSGPGAILEAAATFVEAEDLEKLPGNILSAIVDTVALALRRRILLNHLDHAGWNLSHVAERFRMADASAVIREIKRCGLEKEYAAAKKRGAVNKSGHRTRAPDTRGKPPT